MIYDARALVAVQRRLRNLGLSFYPASESKRIGSDSIVIVDKVGEKILNRISGSPSLIINVDNVGIDKAVCLALLSSMGLSAPAHKLVIGIDFGKNIGFAIVADGELLHYGISPSLHYVLSEVMWFTINLPYSELILRIGATSGRESDALILISKLNSILPKSAKIELVNEESSSSNKPRRFSYVKGDARAALNIALFSGEGIEIER